MKWLRTLFSKNDPIKEENPANEDKIDQLIWNKEHLFISYNAANRLGEPEWMLHLRQDTLTIAQIKELINTLPPEELLQANSNNETLLSLLIESDSKIPAIQALIDKYPQAYDHNFKIKQFKSYLEYCLEKHNLEAFNLLVKGGWSHWNFEQTSSFLTQLNRFVKDDNSILSDVFTNLNSELNVIPLENIIGLFKSIHRNEEKYLFSTAHQKICLFLLVRGYFKDKDLDEIQSFFYNLLTMGPYSLTRENTFLQEIKKELIEQQIATSLMYQDQALVKKLSVVNNQIYLSKISKNLSELGITNRSLLRALGQKLYINHQGILVADHTLVNFIAKFNAIDPQLLVPLVEKWEPESDFAALISKSPQWTPDLLLQVYSPQRVITLFINEMNNLSMTQYEWTDTLRNLQLMNNVCTDENLNIHEFLPEKPQNFHQLHETTWRETSKLKQKNILLHKYYPENLMKLNKQKFEEYTIVIPTDSHSLVTAGQSMSICVGSGGYRDMIINKKSFIVLLTQKGQVMFCIQVGPDNVIYQFRGKQNQQYESSQFCADFKKLL